MKKFLIRILIFILVLIGILIVGIFLPPTPNSKNSMLYAKLAKDSLLKTTPSPRIIFIGGSNISFGLNGKLIKDTLGLNPINTGLHANIGLIYMMDQVLEFVQKGDIVVISAEYEQFLGELAYGKGELLHMVLEIDKAGLGKLKSKQIRNIPLYFPKYGFSKFNPLEYLPPKKNNFYGATAFNSFGDAYIHWKMEKIPFQPFDPPNENLNENVLDELVAFAKKVKKKGARLFIAFPAFQAASFDNFSKEIHVLEAELKKRDILLLSKPERYKMPDSLMFNTPYHLTKTGADIRTLLLIEDLKSQIKFPFDDLLR